MPHSLELPLGLRVHRPRFCLTPHLCHVGHRVVRGLGAWRRCERFALSAQLRIHLRFARQAAARHARPAHTQPILPARRERHLADDLGGGRLWRAAHAVHCDQLVSRQQLATGGAGGPHGDDEAPLAVEHNANSLAKGISTSSSSSEEIESHEEERALSRPPRCSAASGATDGANLPQVASPRGTNPPGGPPGGRCSPPLAERRRILSSASSRFSSVSLSSRRGDAGEDGRISSPSSCSGHRQGFSSSTHPASSSASEGFSSSKQPSSAVAIAPASRPTSRVLWQRHSR
eukprot:scaffold74020_cov27-Tisochrysis_lutea.AAC.4